MKTSFFLIGAALLSLGAGAQAQGRGNGNQNRGNQGRNQGGNGGATLPLPDGVESVVSIDAFNILLAQTNRDGQRDLSPIIVRHIYSGGVARLFGGQTVPTELFVTPGEFGGGGNSGGNSGISGGTNRQGGGQSGGQSGGQNSNLGGGFNGGGQIGGDNGGGNFGAFQIRPLARMQTATRASVQPLVRPAMRRRN